MEPSTIVTNHRQLSIALERLRTGSDVNGEPEARVPAWLLAVGFVLMLFLKLSKIDISQSPVSAQLWHHGNQLEFN
jgi:hypothetical protein